jgi:Tfp pilus assembly protein PilN
MKSINFIKPITNEARTSTDRWFKISTLACVTVIIALTAITIHQVYNLYYSPISTTAQMPSEPIDIQTHETKLSELEKLHTKLITNKDKQRTPALALQELQDRTHMVEITNLSFLPHKQYKVEGTASAIENVTNMLANLNQATHLYDSTITSIQPIATDSVKGVHFTLTGRYRLNL